LQDNNCKNIADLLKKDNQLASCDIQSIFELPLSQACQPIGENKRNNLCGQKVILEIILFFTDGET
jgi:hypothetical protein